MASQLTTVEEPNRTLGQRRILSRVLGAFVLLASLSTIANSEDEFALPIRSCLDLAAREKSAGYPHRVHVQGVVQTSGEGNLLVIRDHTGSIEIETSRNKDLNPGLVLDVVGSWTQRQATPVLSDVKFRRIGIAGTNQLALSRSAAASSRILTSVQQVRALKPEEAALSLPVRVRCVVTYYDDSEWGALFVQDSTAGIYVDAHGHTLDLDLGQWVDLEGVTAPG